MAYPQKMTVCMLIFSISKLIPIIEEPSLERISYKYIFDFFQIQ